MLPHLPPPTGYMNVSPQQLRQTLSMYTNRYTLIARPAFPPTPHSPPPLTPPSRSYFHFPLPFSDSLQFFAAQQIGEACQARVLPTNCVSCATATSNVLPELPLLLAALPIYLSICATVRRQRKGITSNYIISKVKRK